MTIEFWTPTLYQGYGRNLDKGSIKDFNRHNILDTASVFHQVIVVSEKLHRAGFLQLIMDYPPA